jgi:hypothetical protein
MDNLELLSPNEFVTNVSSGWLVCPLCHTGETIECEDDGWGDEATYWSVNYCDWCKFMWETTFTATSYIPISTPEQIAEIKATWGVQLEMPLGIDEPSTTSRKLVDWH